MQFVERRKGGDRRRQSRREDDEIVFKNGVAIKANTFSESFKRAFLGVKITLSSNRNLFVMIFATMFNILFSFIFLNVVSSTALLLPYFLLISLEMLNTSIEKICNVISRGNYSTDVRKIKDISAASVLVFSLGVAINTLMIYTSVLL